MRRSQHRVERGRVSGKSRKKNHPVTASGKMGVVWLVASVELNMGTCGDGIRKGGEGGLFRNLGGQMDSSALWEVVAEEGWA